MATLTELEGQIGAATGELSGFQTSQKNPLQLLNEATASLGIPEVRTRVSGLRKSLLDTENLLAGVEGSVQGRTQGQRVTEAQRLRLTNLERQPIAEQLGKTQGAYGMETGNLRDLMGEASQQVSLGLEGQRQQETAIKTKLDALKDTYGRELAAEEERTRIRELAEKTARDAAEAEADRQFKASESAKSNAASAANKEVDTKKQALAQIGSVAFKRELYRTGQKRESIIPDLISAGFSTTEAQKMVYAYFPDNWEKQVAPRG